VYSRDSNRTNSSEIFFDESQKLSGLVVALLALVTSSATPNILSACDGDVIGPTLVWQAAAAMAISATGLVELYSS
jgi:hypothetical protein